MDLTTWLAVLGFATGVVGLGWQIATHWLTGRRLQVLALRERSQDGWVIQTHIMNVGRLDVSVQSYSVWADFAGRRLYRLWWRLRAIRKMGWSHALRTQVTFSPSVTIAAPGGFADNATRAQFPFILKAGEMYVLPTLGVRLPPVTDRVLTVAVGLGVGRPVRAKVLDVSALSHRIDVPEESGWRMSVTEAWGHPAFAPVADPIAPGSRALTVLAAEASNFLDDLSFLRIDDPVTVALKEGVSEARDYIMMGGNVSLSRLQNLRELLDGGGPAMTMLASGQQLERAVDAAIRALTPNEWHALFDNTRPT